MYSTAITNLDFFCTFSGLLTGISKVYLCLRKLNKPKLISYGAKNVIPFLTPYGAKTGSVLAPYGAKTGNPVWHHMVPHGATWCQKVPKRGTPFIRKT